MDILFSLYDTSKNLAKYCIDLAQGHGVELQDTIKLEQSQDLTFRIYNVTRTLTKDTTMHIDSWNPLWRDTYDKEYTLATFPFDKVFELTTTSQDKNKSEIICICGYKKYDEIIYLHSLAINKNYTKQGFSSLFCKHVTAYSKTQGLELLLGYPENTPMWLKQVYAKYGFAPLQGCERRFDKCVEYKTPKLFYTDNMLWVSQKK